MDNSSYSKQSVVMDYSGGSSPQIEALIRHIHNLLKDFNNDLKIDLVCYSNGLQLLLRTSTYAAELKELQQKGIRLKACQNAMITQKVSPKELLEGTEIVSAGIGHIIRRQLEGAAYYKV